MKIIPKGYYAYRLIKQYGINPERVTSDLKIMKLFIALAAVSILMVSAGDCGKKPEAKVKYKGRLEI